MPVRRVFLVIGSVAIVGIVGAVIVRQAAAPVDDFSRLSVKAAEVTPAMKAIVPDTTGAAPVLANPFVSPVAETTAQAVVPIGPAVVLPGSQQPAAGSAPAAAPAAAPAPAPDAPPPPAATPSPAPAAAPASGTKVDETALRYFARQGDTRRLNAEIARLHALYPEWTPPTDMTAPVAITDPQLDAMWKLYSEGRYAAARAAIAERIAREPEWVVPADLLARLDIGEQRERLVNASSAKQWNTVVAIAAATPSLLTCADVEVLWRVAEAFAKTDRTGRARDVGTYILTNCQDPKERLATIQKAMQYLSDAELNDLLALERVGADGQGEFAPVKADLARRRIGAAAKDPTLSISPDDVALLEQLAKDGRKADDAVLLGSYLFGQKDSTQSAQWFELAKSRADTPEIARGLAYALNDLKRPAEAEQAAYRWRDSGPENKDAYLIAATALLAIDPPAKIEPDVLARIAKTFSEDKHVLGARELGWYAYNTGQTLSAARWFTAALTWKPDDEPSAFGLALAYDKLGNKAAFQQVIRVWGPKSQRIAELGDPKARRLVRPGTVELPMPPSIANPTGLAKPIVATQVMQPAPAVQTTVVQDYAAPDGSVAVLTSDAPAPVRAVRPARTKAAPARGGACGGRVSASQLSGMSALNRGWCLMDLNRPIEAADAFDIAMESGSEKTRQDAAYGKTLANLRSGLTDAASVSAAALPQDDRRSVEMRTEILTQRALAAYNDARYVETLLFLDERSQIAPEQNDLLMIRAWSYFHLHRIPEAKRLFVAAAGTGSRDALRALATIATGQQGQTVGDVRDRR